MAKALDCRSGEESACRFIPIPVMGDFFLFNDDGGALHSSASESKARALKRVQSTKPEGAKNANAKHKA